MSRILITGGAGFIGSTLAHKLLDKGDEVVILDDLSSGRKDNVPSQADFIQDSITNREVVDSLISKVDLCYHMAAIPSVQSSISNWSHCHYVNSYGAVNIFEAAAQHGVGVVYASSAAVYGTPEHFPINEKDLCPPLSPYALDKFNNEQQAKLFGELKGLKSIGMRFFNVYGPAQDPHSPYSGVIAIFLDAISQGKKVKIFGDGLQTRDFIYIDDVVSMLQAAGNNIYSLYGKVFNVCTGQETSINDLVDTLCEIYNIQVEREYLPAVAGDIYKSIGSAQYIQEQLSVGWEADIKSGLKKLVQHQNEDIG